MIGHPSAKEPTTASAANAIRKAIHMLDGYPRASPPNEALRGAIVSGTGPLAPSVAG